LKNGTDAKELELIDGNSVCMGAVPPLIIDTGMESMTQFIFLGALQNIRQTLQQLS
jgi:hypothetical protein